MSIVIVGATFELTIEFADEDGFLFDPDADTGVITLRSPAEALDEGVPYALDDPAVTNPSVGRYILSGLATEAGRWHWRAEGDQSGKHRVGEGAFDVKFSRVIGPTVVSS